MDAQHQVLTSCLFVRLLGISRGRSASVWGDADKILLSNPKSTSVLVKFVGTDLLTSVQTMSEPAKEIERDKSRGIRAYISEVSYSEIQNLRMSEQLPGKGRYQMTKTGFL